MSNLTFSVVGYSESATRVSVKARDFTLIVDEPPALGGQDHGPNPVEYELSALVGCINVMGHIIAREMKFKINSLEIKASGQLNPDRLLGKKTADRSGYKSIEVALLVDADTDADTLDLWMERIESRCPVSDNLANSTPVSLELKALSPV